MSDKNEALLKAIKRVNKNRSLVAAPGPLLNRAIGHAFPRFEQVCKEALLHADGTVNMKGVEILRTAGFKVEPSAVTEQIHITLDRGNYLLEIPDVSTIQCKTDEVA